ncbi:MAG: hemerythrin family protein [Oryzomonas sp.]|uniref:bacteriohemerythrin n=1 Tax=Oryzomonas sp. TaxID=2855186 RepID=UPI002849A81A|nr:hemerythrin family protein [Oryzomonas sp.]MDR3578330.1 hemerythrin family protein [Oryzomonas sp.]
MTLPWHRGLETGNAHIDSQHRELFERIYALIAACKDRRERQEIGTLFTFLKQYVQKHFAAEEEFQLRHNYPHHREHAKLHESLMQHLFALEAVYLREGSSLPVVTNSLMFTYEWLTDHILHWDRQMANFVAASERPAAAGPISESIPVCDPALGGITNHRGMVKP